MSSPAPLAGRWRRLFAGVLDLVIIAIVSTPFGWTGWQHAGEAGKSMWGRMPFGHAFIGSIIAFFYFWLLHSYWNGQTVGKKVFGMRVVRETGQKATVGQIAIREAVRVVLSWVCCVGALIDLGWILFDPRKQALHDKAGKTIVVDA
jgi:uncharacterized RDD family membrane protein YckC